MRLPLDLVLRRGVVFLWPEYKKLDDPTLAGQSKPKFGVILSQSALDDPLVYILTTSKAQDGVRSADVLYIKGGKYDFLPLDTYIDVGKAGELESGREEFAAQYECGAVIYKGQLDDQDVKALVDKILASPRVSRRFKHVLSGE